MSIDLGNRRVEVLHPGEGHTRGDAVVWLPDEEILFAGDLVEYGATPYCGDAQLKKWPTTLQILSDMQPKSLVPGRGEALQDEVACQRAILGTRRYVNMLLDEAVVSVARGESLGECYRRVMEKMRPLFGHWVIFDHCMCFNVTRAYEEASGMTHPQIWTKERDLEMWERLEG